MEWRAGRFVAQRESGSLRLRSALLTLHPARLCPLETVWASQKSPAIESILSRIDEEATQAQPTVVLRTCNHLSPRVNGNPGARLDLAIEV